MNVGALFVHIIIHIIIHVIIHTIISSIFSVNNNTYLNRCINMYYYRY